MMNETEGNEQDEQIWNLLCPGPVNMTEVSLNEMSKAMIGHREEEMHKIINDTRKLILQRAFPDGVHPDYDAVILTASGSGAVETMVGSFVRSQEPCENCILLVSNGSFGERWIDMVQCHCSNHVPYRTGWGIPIDQDDVFETAVKLGVKGVFLVHHETSVGVINCFDRLAERLDSAGIALLVDSVSAFGIEDVPMKHISLLAVSANKALCGPPGLAFVIGRKSVFEACHTGASFYLHLQKHYRFMQTLETPFTPAIPLIRGVHVALGVFQKDPDTFVQNVQHRMKRVLRIMNGLGIRPISVLPERHQSRWLITAWYPRSVLADPDAFHESLRSSGFIVYRGKGYLSGVAFQTAVIGEITDDILDRFQTALSKACNTGRWGGPNAIPALILLAGDGDRLEQAKLGHPIAHKSLIDLGHGQTIISRMLSQLQRLRVEGYVSEIHIVVGHAKDAIVAAARDVEPEVIVHDNEDYLSHKTSGSARVALEEMTANQRVVVLDGDVVMDEDVIRRVVTFPKTNLAVSRPAVVGTELPEADAVKVDYDRLTCQLKAIGKDVSGVGEAIGVYQVKTKEAVDTLRRIGDQRWFDDMLWECKEDVCHVLDVTGLPAAGVDVLADIAVARAIVDKEF
ncbi:Aminotransferase class-V [Carpediemonas membranifera]|uniref:Aminotransferase class-V n=1 Tax=Carpediemonas membranifera TaxID=201153 RepID=A0A8J6AR74_9EUKA|nr:Aminotransferase class-V [Carpediemonas membranifera]|eukprot:KAG9391873.1 Aminotransferase class-V [Carpediemonas membranifera]